MMLDVAFLSPPLVPARADLWVFPIVEGQGLEPLRKKIDPALRKSVSEKMKKVSFVGKEGETLRTLVPRGTESVEVLLVGLGEEKCLSVRSWRRLGSRCQKEALGAEKIGVLMQGNITERHVAWVLDGFLSAGYQFKKYKSEKAPSLDSQVILFCQDALGSLSACRKMCGTTSRVLQGVYLARDLVNEPASVATPAFLAEQALVHCRGRGLKVEVWTKKRIEKERLAGLLAVSRGSTEEPRFIKISYQGGGPSKKKIALIGKGITFDSGGLSLKTPKAMETMKRDMAGAAAVIGVMSLLPDLGLRLDVQGYIPATDNLPSGAAQKPGDIIRYANGRSVEVLNTDAEGRLILADALDLAARSGADFIIDVATLTGACVVALGQEIAGVMGNDQELIDLLFDAGRRSDEGLWQLPLPREYREEIKSTIADIKNVGGGSAGAITAALFLQEFVGKSPWAHLDIAGPAFWEKDSPFGPAGGTGFGVKTLAHFLMGLSGRSLSR